MTPFQLFRTVLAASFVLLAAVLPAHAGVTLTSGVDLNNNPCDIISWMDSMGKPRVLWIVKGTPGAFVSRYTYYVKGQLVDARPRENYPPWGFLVLANHWHPENSGNFVTSAGNSSAGSSSYLSKVTPKVAFTGQNHLVWQGSFKMRMDPANAMQGFYITIQYFIVNGRDDFTWSVAYDGGDAPEGYIWSDNRSPYGDFDFDGDGSSNEALSGLGWGTLYRFKTLGSHLGKDSAWDYMQPNTIPYIWMWKDTTMNDREMGIVKNQPYSEQNSGMECHVGGCGEFAAPPSKGRGMPSNIGCIGYQLNSYAGFTGERFTWGSNYKNAWGLFGNGKGVFENGHGEAFGTYTYDNQYPVNAWSMNVEIGSWSSQGVPRLVADTESIYASKLTVSAGTAVAQGPRGPGNFL